MPEASIVIRTLNEEKRLGNLLEALKAQTFQKYEVIIVDSGSSDRTLEIAKKYPVRIIEIASRDFTFGYALNVGCKESRGKYLVFASAHVLPLDAQWLENLLKPFENQQVAMVYGKQRGTAKSKFSERRDFMRLFQDAAANSHVPLSYANNANAAVRRDLWERERFDEYLFGLEDIAWARALTDKGYLIHYEPTAAVYHIHLETWPQVFNRYRREAIAAVRIGLPEPPQAKLGMHRLLLHIVLDMLSAFPKLMPLRIEEILRFRYYQWKGSRVGWKQGRDLSLDTDKQDVFNPIENVSVVISGKDQAALKETALREMKPGDILIKVEYVGVCRTDLEVLEGTLGYYRDEVASYPIVPGHEFSGTIVRIGSNNRFQERFTKGQKVVGECVLSRNPENRKEVGVINYNGAYSTYVVIPGDAVHKIPEGLSLQKAALTEPLAVVLRAIRRVRHRLQSNAHIAVIGAGTIGYLCAQALKLEGFTVAVFDKDPRRLSYLAPYVHATSTVLDGLHQFDAIFEVTGSKDALEQVIKESRTDVTLMLLGFPYGNVSYNFEDLVGQEKVFAGSVGGDSEDFMRALTLLPRIPLSEEMVAVLPLSDFKKAWELHRSSARLKVFLQPESLGYESH